MQISQCGNWIFDYNSRQWVPNPARQAPSAPYGQVGFIPPPGSFALPPQGGGMQSGATLLNQHGIPPGELRPRVPSMQQSHATGSSPTGQTISLLDLISNQSAKEQTTATRSDREAMMEALGPDPEHQCVRAYLSKTLDADPCLVYVEKYLDTLYPVDLASSTDRISRMAELLTCVLSIYINKPAQVSQHYWNDMVSNNKTALEELRSKRLSDTKMPEFNRPIAELIINRIDFADPTVSLVPNKNQITARPLSGFISNQSTPTDDVKSKTEVKPEPKIEQKIDEPVPEPYVPLVEPIMVNQTLFEELNDDLTKVTEEIDDQFEEIDDQFIVTLVGSVDEIQNTFVNDLIDDDNEDLDTVGYLSETSPTKVTVEHYRLTKVLGEAESDLLSTLLNLEVEGFYKWLKDLPKTRLVLNLEQAIASEISLALVQRGINFKTSYLETRLAKVVNDLELNGLTSKFVSHLNIINGAIASVIDRIEFIGKFHRLNRLYTVIQVNRSLCELYGVDPSQLTEPVHLPIEYDLKPDTLLVTTDGILSLYLDDGEVYGVLIH